MRICTNSDCRESTETPRYGAFYGRADIRVSCHDDFEELIEIANDFRCYECDSISEWCEDCNVDYYCDDHSFGDNRFIETHTSPFSERVWVSK